MSFSEFQKKTKLAFELDKQQKDITREFQKQQK
jgi:hypothetical protein